MTTAKTPTSGLAGGNMQWRPDEKNPDHRTHWRRDSQCGTYRIEYVRGVSGPIYIASYLPTPTMSDSIAVERTEAQALQWVLRHAGRKAK